MARASLADVKRAGDVRLQEAVERIGWKFVQRRAMLHPRVVDQDIDDAVIALEPVDRGAGIGGIGYVEGQRLDCPARLTQAGGGGVQLGRVAPVQDNGRAGIGKTPARGRNRCPARIR